MTKQRKALDAERKANSTSAGLSGVEKKAVEAPYKEKIASINTEIILIDNELKSFGGKAPKSLRRDDPGVWQGYRKADKEAVKPNLPCSIFDSNLIILKLTGKRLGLNNTQTLTQALRGALLKDLPKPIPEWLCEHTENAAPYSNAS